mgnify:CR=1 FL=1
MEMPVDLASGTCGIVVFEGGTKFYCLEVEEHRPGEFLIRWESGWRKSYYRDGRSRSARGAHCISFVPCRYDDPSARGLPTESTP